MVFANVRDASSPQGAESGYIEWRRRENIRNSLRHLLADIIRQPWEIDPAALAQVIEARLAWEADPENSQKSALFWGHTPWGRMLVAALDRYSQTIVGRYIDNWTRQQSAQDTP